MALLGRLLGTVLGAGLAFAGLLGLVCAYFAAAPIGETADNLIDQFAISVPFLDLSGRRIEDALVHPGLRFTLAPVGFALIGFALFGFRDRASIVIDGDDPTAVAPLGDAPTSGDKRSVKRILKHAAALQKKGQHLEAAEILLEAEQLDEAAQAFIDAEEPIRAAEIRHDQNRFVESAELYLESGDFQSAGAIFAQQEEYARAADCYLKSEAKSTAAEMFEKAEDYESAARCYKECEFLRHAAHCFVKCEEWREAAECLETVYGEESHKSGQSGDARRMAELAKLVRQAGKLYKRAGDIEKAQAVLERGGCYAEAAAIAVQRDDHARAAELYLEAGDAPNAAESLRAQGESAEAARVLAEHYRDAGDHEQAAESFLEAGEFLAAGDLFRQAESHQRAAECYAQQGDHAQAAEMFSVAGDRSSAADSYERAGMFREAAECCALEGEGLREAEMLEQAEDFLAAGEGYRREGDDERSIRCLQQVEPGSHGFGTAAALLGDIFRSRGQLSLAIAKLRQAIGESELTRESLPSYYTLATILEENGNLDEAVDTYERILTLDYHHQDVAARLAGLRDRGIVGTQPAETGDGTVRVGPSAAGESAGGSARYQIVGELGRGGMGIVYKATDTMLDRPVAFKVLPDSLKANPQALKNFLREAKAAAKLNHPNIVTVYDTGEQDGRFYIAMEFVDGTTIKEIVRRRGPIAPAGVLHVLVQMCEALAYAHAQKVVHRDIKTANTMWTRDKKAKLMDFGLAKVVEEVRNHTTVVSGTPYYMSPEQTLGKNVDHRTDIYSLGVTLYEMVVGTVPFKDGNIPYHHVHTPPPDVREHCEGLPESLAAIIDRCLEKDPAHRFQSTQEILEEVRRSLVEQRET